MATITQIQLQNGQIYDLPQGGVGETYTLSISGHTITLTGDGGTTSSVTVPDDNTTYTISISGNTLTLTPSSGSPQTVTLPDNDTTYTMSISGNDLTLTPSSGTAQTITLPIPSEEVFIAEYGVTPFAEVLSAYNTDKSIILKRNTSYYHVDITPANPQLTKFYMRYISANRTISNATIDSNDTWAVTSYPMQATLTSGTNIKTINGQSLLGSGDLPVAPPVTSTDVPTADTISEFDADAHMNSTDMTTQDVNDFVDGLNVQGGGWVYVPLSSSNPSMYTNPAGGYYKLGRLVVVQCRFYVTGTFPSSDYNTVTSGLPVPSLIQASLGVTWNYADSATHASAVVSSTGSLVVQSGSKALTASTLFITGAYIAE